ncbi:MAG: copper-translocating P-type ATPase [Candidatus Izemoplasmataceae bacterium]
MENHESHDHHNHHKMMIEDFKRRFFVTLILTIPILVLSKTIQGWFGFSIDFTGQSLILFALASIVFVYGGWPFLKGTFDEVKEKNIGMMTLIGLAISVAYLYSSAVVFGLEGADFFWELATLILIMLLGHWIEMRSVLSASSALDKLVELLPNEATLIKDGEHKQVSVSELTKGQRVLVKPGEKIPVDGIILKGSTSIDESVITGESKPVQKKEDDKVIAGSINQDGSIEIEVKHLEGENYLSKVITMVQEAQDSKSKTQNLADKAAFWLTVISITIGITTFTVWYILQGDLAFAITRMATVMVITCPHALGLAIPLVVANSTTLSAKNGLLIRNRTAFENSRNITKMVFDKTGTLTEGKFQVNEIKTYGDYNEENVLRIVASIEQNSEHPIAGAITKKAKEENLSMHKISDFEALKGEGVKGTIDGETFYIVSPKYLSKNDIKQPDDGPTSKIATNIYLVLDNKVIAVFGLSDKIRPESYDAIKTLQNRGVECWMLTGDNEETAKEVSNELGLDGYFAEVMPDEKQKKIKELQDMNEIVAMTGDGVNDAPALAQADIGIAVGSGTDVAVETADIVLVNSNPNEIVNLSLFGEKTYNKMIQNIIWATAYNVVAIPLAAGVLYNQGIIISPAIGAIFMSLSTVIVAINAKLLKFTK